MEQSTKKLKVVGTVTEFVYAILKESGSPMHHKEITDRIVAMMPDATEPDPKLIARIHTDINLDNRFYHMGNGMWGLREWAPKKVLQQKPAPGGGGWAPKAGTKPKRPEFWRGDEDGEDLAKNNEEEDGDWPRDNEDDDRPEAS